MTPDAGWVLDDRFSAADVVFGGALAFFSGFKMLEPTPKVSAYVARIMARPAYQKTHAGF
jgi:glutathione S-transferase